MAPLQTFIETPPTMLATRSDGLNAMPANGKRSLGNLMTSSVETAIAAADVYHGRGTTYVHANSQFEVKQGNENAAANITGAAVPPISLATTFMHAEPGEPASGNPTRGVFERAVAAAEKANYCVAFSSGSAATSAVVNLLSPGEKILSIDDVCGGTRGYFRQVNNPRMGIEVDFVDFTDNSALLSKMLSDGDKTKLVWLETPTNPALKVTDIEKVSTFTKRFNARTLLAVDNTLCSPYFQNPLEQGADIVVHSVSEYINGHSDVAIGVVCTNNEEVYKQLRFIQNCVGAVPSPFDCYLAHRGLKTLHLRMEAAARNANAIAIFLEGHHNVTKAVYPGLKSHPQHDLATRQQSGYGAIITFCCVGGIDQSAMVLQNLKVFTVSNSLGGVESLAECPSLTTHASISDEQRASLGIDDSLIRLSIGIESCADLITDLDNALNATQSSSFLPDVTPADDVLSASHRSFLPDVTPADEDEGNYWEW